MAESSTIEWTDATWQPITGCAIVSPGCTNCYAMKLAGTRLRNLPSRKGLTVQTKAGPVWNGKVRLNEEWLTQPLTWRRPRKIFVCAHGDLFAEGVQDEWIDRVFAVMALCPQHTFQVLTKRSARMRQWFEERWQPTPAQRIEFPGLPAFDAPAQTEGDDRHERVYQAAGEFLDLDTVSDRFWNPDGSRKWPGWPLPNVWLGVSAEDQRRADERVPDLLATPAAVRFVSAEPLLAPLDLSKWLHDGRREVISGADRLGAIQGRAGRDDLAISQVDRRRPSVGADLYLERTSGAERGRTRQLSSSDVQGWRSAEEDQRASHRLDDLQPQADTGSHGDQSPRRGQAEQPPSQSRGGFASAERASLSRASHAKEEGSARSEELCCGGHRGAGDADPRDMARSSDEPARDRRQVQHHAVDSIRDRASDQLGSPPLDWVIVGGESGPGARPMHPDWARQIRDACAAAGVAYLFKQHGAWVSTEGWYADHPVSLPIRTWTDTEWTDDGRYADREWVALVGKKVAGRLLDGVEHNGFPEVRS